MNQPTNTRDPSTISQSKNKYRLYNYFQPHTSIPRTQQEEQEDEDRSAFIIPNKVRHPPPTALSLFNFQLNLDLVVAYLLVTEIADA